MKHSLKLRHNESQEETKKHLPVLRWCLTKN